MNARTSPFPLNAWYAAAYDVEVKKSALLACTSVEDWWPAAQLSKEEEITRAATPRCAKDATRVGAWNVISRRLHAL